MAAVPKLNNNSSNYHYHYHQQLHWMFWELNSVQGSVRNYAKSLKKKSTSKIIVNNQKLMEKERIIEDSVNEEEESEEANVAPSVIMDEKTMDEEVERNSKLQTPPGLYIIATPIGNLNDISERAKFVLSQSNMIACEDTRTTRKLLHFHSLISDPPQQLISFVENKNASEVYSQSKKHLSLILNRLTSSSDVVSVVSECGSPCISDPGWILVKNWYVKYLKIILILNSHELGVPVYSVPGPSSIIAALSISGFNSNRFIFDGFLPAIPKKRRKLLQELREIQGNRCVVFFENPNRIKQTLADCVEIFGGDTQIALCFELTKLFERIQKGKLSTIERVMRNEDIKGECTIIIGNNSE
ncbi:predicted protein [Naegleria gruberi]|uniref:Predicted protein n=1 Tax=Naegleria gruberi TaxID=5762 RepID=D2V2A6_NAEGR|nr:uncharacterized protein NAEGRDRAFT_46122 [Naegleria gruberi]EFC48866.1 predicted protein [Naegleria gruberi]|eukprot:XP_002681610.1 predicted protein [Naegleria gruberi strain NEG-M]